MDRSKLNSAVRRLVPKSYHFDGYDELNCPNSRDEPFFTSHTIWMGNYYLATTFKDTNTLSIQFSGIGNLGNVRFEEYILTLDEYIDKLKAALREKRDFIYLEIRPIYGRQCVKMEDNDIPSANSSYDVLCTTCTNEECRTLMKNRPKVVFAAVSFEMEEVSHALSYYYGMTNKEENKMKNSKKLLGMNFEFGISKDPSIASTLMGVAVKNRKTGSWIIYDPKHHKRTDTAGMKLGDFPIFLLPVQTLSPGDLIKLDGEYYNVQNIKSKQEVTLLSPETGVIHDHLMSDLLIPGLNFYTKVVAIDLSSMTDLSSKQNVSGNVMAAMCMMQWAKGNKTDSFSSLDDITDDSFNGLGKCLPLLLAMNGGIGGGLSQAFVTPEGTPNFMALMALSGDNDDDSMTQMLLLSQLMGGASPLSGLTDAVTSLTDGGEKVVCESCGKTYPAGTNFCPACGGKTHPAESDEVWCEKCGTSYPAGTNFCPKCGSRTVKKVSTCPHCGASLMEGATFCHKCGNKVTPSLCECGHPLTGDEAFCPKCGKKTGGDAPAPTLAAPDPDALTTT